MDSIDHKVATKILRLNSIHDPEPNSFSFFDENDDEEEEEPPTRSPGPRIPVGTLRHSSQLEV